MSGNDELLAGLTQLSESAFPKHCPACGAIYNSAAEFVEKTHALANNRSIKAIDDAFEGHFLELYRNCPCGSTLMDFFSERRDLSPQGLARRKQFGELLVILQSKGLSEESARRELLAFLRGQPSSISTLLSRA